MVLDIQLLRDTALDVIRNVVKEDKLHEFTYGTFRKRVEQTLSLESGTLDAPEYRTAVHAVAKDYISKLEQGGEASAEEDGPAKETKPGSASRKSREAQPRKPRTKADPGKATAKKAANSKKTTPRSASVVPSSDEEARSGTDAKPSSNKPESKAKSKKVKRIESESEGSDADRPAKPPSQGAKNASASTDHAEERAASASPAHPAGAESNRALPERDHDDAKSESEMSVLIDEPPSRKRKKKGESGVCMGSSWSVLHADFCRQDSQAKKAPKGKKRKESGKELSKDEETIKRLKSLVVACGVRKVWSKEFKGLEKPSDQIRRLKQILGDLGMTGRMSMEQAKAIKAKREFEKELEDVQEFASKVVSGPSRRRGPAAAGDANDDEEEGSDVDMVKKRRTARQSIMAFLGDESE
ncbi:hypothetical protein OH77DRAFT_1587914 [Trametes cingulata]|nr:hypothetical protein OH77DRAFT_1587914 [Trametes cingulata]